MSPEQARATVGILEAMGKRIYEESLREKNIQTLLEMSLEQRALREAVSVLRAKCVQVVANAD